MPKLEPHDIYLVARHAGFSPDQAVTMTAIAMAESSGDTQANLVVGDTEDSWGLWQINMTVHQGALGSMGDPRNPLINAQMAYQVSKGGTDIGRWTVTHADKGSRYLQYRDVAEQAARTAEPGVEAHGEWDAPTNYTSGLVSAGDTSFDPPPPPLPMDLMGSGDDFVDAVTSQAGNVFIDRAMAQQGDRYIFGKEVEMDDADPDAFDCSELVQWAAAQAGVNITDGSWYQYQHVDRNGGSMSIEEALETPGALLFRFGSDPNGQNRPDGAHVAISLGDGRTIEARGKAYGVGVFDGEDRGWTHAGVIPELAGATGGLSTIIAPPIDHLGDSDGDLILDSFEQAIGTDPFNADSDMDGFIDSVELLDYGTDPLDASSNPRSDSMRAMGIEPTIPPAQIESDFSGYVSPAAAAQRARAMNTSPRQSVEQEDQVADPPADETVIADEEQTAETVVADQEETADNDTNVPSDEDDTGLNGEGTGLPGDPHTEDSIEDLEVYPAETDVDSPDMIDSNDDGAD